MLDVNALECMPLDPHKFGEGSRFAPLFQQAKRALRAEPLLPAHGGGHTAGESALLASSQAMRELINADQLAELFPSAENPAWISSEITFGRTHEFYEYLRDELEIREVGPDFLVDSLTKSFLEAQPDEWIQNLYEFLNGQRSLLPRLRLKPLVRLEDDKHTVPFEDGELQAYLQGERPTDYPTVKSAVCQSKEALEFLRVLGLRRPDPVDDVIDNVLPKYQKERVEVDVECYEADIGRLIAAYKTDSTQRRDELVNALRESRIVCAVDAETGTKQFALPSEAYMPTERLKALFEGVPGVLFLDDSLEWLVGDSVSDLLVEAGASPELKRVWVKTELSFEKKSKLRRGGGCTFDIGLDDYTIVGLDAFIRKLGSLPKDEARNRAGILWGALLEVRHSQNSWESQRWFNGRYSWFYYSDRSALFPARFVKTLNSIPWVPNSEGELDPPAAVAFRTTGWGEDQFLLEMFAFKPDVVDKLAEEVGIEPDALSLLKEKGITTLEGIKNLLGILDEPEYTPPEGPEDDGSPSGDEDVQEGLPREQGKGGLGASGGGGERTGRGGGRTPGSPRVGRKRFESYIKVDHDEHDEHPDSPEYQRRIRLEEQAIDYILSRDPNLVRTPPNNPGFDLTEVDENGELIRWIEVKGMRRTLEDNLVIMTHTEFKHAQEYGDAYWLYIVENAGDESQAKLIAIRNPAGKARSFTFDKGWALVAEDPD